MSQLELLAPAGAWEQLIAAVQNGADAVYLGGKAFGARRFAGNFERDEMLKAFAYCHERGVRAYVTCNTLLLDRELADALEYAAFLYEAGADALLVQDMGLVRMLRSQLPDLILHASTQMAIHDENGLQLCKQLGIQRAVLARELSLSRVRGLSACGIELECFAHGALCTSVSGVCLFSSLAGGRSGNRGECAQPCRKPYEVAEGKSGYPLSLQDMSMLFHVQDLREAGVSSIKLEGRMKRPEYVAAMTRAYRMAMDGATRAELEREQQIMRRIFTRGCSTGYFFGPDVPAHARGELLSEEASLMALRETYQTDRRKRAVEAKLSLQVGEPAQLTLKLGGHIVTASGETVQAAQKPPDTKRYCAQIARMGDTPFYAPECALDMPAPAFMPVSALNALRRDAVQALSIALGGGRKAPGVALPALPQAKRAYGGGVLAIVPNAPRAEAAFAAGADVVAVEPRILEEAQSMLQSLQRYRGQGKRLLLQLPAADISGRASQVWRSLFGSGLVDGGVAQNAGQAVLIRGERVAGYLCNAVNAQAVAQLQELGFDRVLLSLELNKPQLRDLLLLGGTGLYGYGRAQLMQLWHCPYRREGGCRDCAALSGGSLRDEAGREFSLDPVRMQADCLTRVRNCESMDILDVLHELPFIGCVALEFTYETAEEVRERVSAARVALTRGIPQRRGNTRGHWARGLQS